MIRSTEQGFKVTSTVEGESVPLSIDMGALVHIMDVLTGLYSDTEMAVIREYSTNAYDAHVAAGNNAPIEVTLPSDLEPFFKVKDYGVGLSHDEIRDIYSKYGASTKTDTNDLVGMLGMGCKSALAYSNQFTLVGVKNGERCMVSISRNEEGVGAINFVEAPSPTDEPNGVEIIVPVQRNNSFATKAQRFYRFWEPGTVLVNGKEPERLELMQVTDDIQVGVVDQDYVVMGNVPYPVRYENSLHSLTHLNSTFHSVARVPIGSVTFTPSRELLKYRPTTVKKLQEIADTVKEHMPAAVGKYISEAKDMREAMRRTIEWRGKIEKQFMPEKVVFGNREIPLEVEAPDNARMTVTDSHSYKLAAASRHRTVAFSTAVNALWITGWDQIQMTAPTKKKLKQYCDENKIEMPPQFILVGFKLSRNITQWLEKDRIIPWEKIKAIKLPRRTSGGGGIYANPDRIKGSYDMWINGTFHEGAPASQIDTTKPVYYLVTGKDDYYRCQNYNKILAACNEEYTFVTFYSNREVKFCRDFPQAQEAQLAKKDFVETWIDMLSNTERDLIAIHQNRKRFYASEYAAFRAIKPTQVADPELRRVALLARQPEPKNLIDMLELLGEVNRRWPIENPLERYPLLSGDGRDFKSHPDHCYTYVNHAYHELIATTDTKDN